MGLAGWGQIPTFSEMVYGSLWNSSDMRGPRGQSWTLVRGGLTSSGEYIFLFSLIMEISFAGTLFIAFAAVIVFAVLLQVLSPPPQTAATPPKYEFENV